MASCRAAFEWPGQHLSSAIAAIKYTTYSRGGGAALRSDHNVLGCIIFNDQFRH
jgi:hypothetical protein